MENRTEIEFTRSIKCAQVFADSTAEYVLPDYNGDVRKILHTSAEIRPSGKFAGGDEVEYSGIVVYEVVYLDEENNLSSVSFTSDYDYSVRCSAESYLDSFAESGVSNYALRLMGPRKISAKASVVGNVRILESDKIMVGGDALDEGDEAEVLERRFKIRKSAVSECREREYAESVAKLDGAIADEVSVISSFADAVIDEVAAGDGEVTLRGNLTLSTIIKNGDAPAYQRDKVVAIEETVPFVGVTETMQFIPKVEVSSLVANINASEIGTEVVVSAVVEVSAVGEYNEEGTLLADAYLKTCAVDNKYEDFSYSELSGVVSSRENESGSVPRSEIEAEGVREVHLLKAIPKVDSAVCEDGRLSVRGDVKYSGIASVTDAEGILGYIPIKFSLPFERLIEVKDGEALASEVHVKAHNIGATFDSSKLYASCLLEVCAVVTEEKHTKRLSSSVKLTDHTFEKDDSRIVIYYPTPNENLFSIAKKYRTTALKIASDNALDARVIADAEGKSAPLGVKKLLIY